MVTWLPYVKVPFLRVSMFRISASHDHEAINVTNGLIGVFRVWSLGFKPKP